MDCIHSKRAKNRIRFSRTQPRLLIQSERQSSLDLKTYSNYNCCYGKGGRRLGISLPDYRPLATKEDELGDPEDTFARLLTACYLELGTLAFLSLTDDVPGQTAHGIAKSIDPTAHWREVKKRSNHITNYFKHLFIDAVSIAKWRTEYDPVRDIEVTYYSLTPFGKSFQGVAFFFLASLTELNHRHHTTLALSEILRARLHKAPACPKRGMESSQQQGGVLTLGPEL